IEAIKTISSMETGRFIFSNSPSDNSKRSINHNIDFEILYDEFGIGSEQDSYFKNAIQSFLRPTDDPNLFVMPAGATPPNPAEMIGSERTKFVIDYMENIFDLIIIDAPPIVPATDALLAAPWTDGTIMVIKSGHADRKIIKEVLEQYKNAKQPIIGAVLNQISLKANGYYKYYNKYYSSDDDQ
ncbi:MAG: CpsD/CapB family tyrosine-protein kinase, partial [Desulfobacteraceae bacterium]|nr:CpsD/CapB family tyrosine-protein kinase [Desulfobacteraceae bacterium]